MNNLARKRLRTVGSFMLWGAGLGALLGPLIGQLDGREPLFSALRGVVIGVLIGLGLGLGEESIFPRWSRSVGFVRLNVVRVAGYTLVMIGALTVVNAVDRSIVLELGLGAAVAIYATDGSLVRDFAFAFTAAFLVTGFLQVRKLHNPGEIRRLLTGQYHYPVEETRVFLFADVAGSTGIAERLGHYAYSSFLRDCFSDVSEAILAWKGEVYQHAGDSVLVTWRMHRGLRSAACVQCFFDMVEGLRRREAEYRDRYGVVPQLRAGIHGGDVVTTWVGEARKDLAFHGDTLNTAARIQAACKEYGAQCLISETIYRGIELPRHLEASSMGAATLRGRSGALRLYAVDRVG